MKIMKSILALMVIIIMLFTMMGVANAASLYDEFLQKKGTLKNNFEQEFAALVEKGYGRKKYGSDLPIPSTEAPERTGQNAYDYFISVYGDMANDPARALQYISSMPDDEFFAIMGGAGKKLNKYSLPTQSALMDLMKGKFDTSILYNLENKASELEAAMNILTDEEARAKAVQEAKDNKDQYKTSKTRTGAQIIGNFLSDILSGGKELVQTVASGFGFTRY